MKIIKAKMKGKKIKLEEPAEEIEDAGVLDLMSRLRASLEQGTAKKAARAKKTPSKPRATKRKSA
jgi:non-homologous end joining protein Ku